MSTEASVAATHATIDTSKLILICAAAIIAVVGFIGGILGYLGLNQLLSEQKELTRSANLLKTVVPLYAFTAQRSLIEAINAEFDKVESLDSLSRNDNVRRQIRDLSAKLKQLAAEIGSGDATTYYLVGESVEPYLASDCKTVVNALDGVRGADRNHFIYHYMRGVCLLRQDENLNAKEAGREFAIAQTLTGGRRQSMSMNAEGSTKLYRWRSEKEPGAIDDAILVFQKIISTDKNFSPAHHNLACAYAQKGEYDNVTISLLDQTKEPIFMPLGTVVDQIQQDLTRPSDRFLEKYVREKLNVRLSPNDPQWRTEMIKKLQ